jgi:hypothetical protein
MPVEDCEVDGKPGYRWGRQGVCYTYDPGNERSRAAARLKAELQGRAIEARRNQENRDGNA